MAVPARGIWSLTARALLLLFEFQGSLFQFEQRGPDCPDSFQLPPNIEALLPAQTLDPSIEHCTAFANFDHRGAVLPFAH